MTPASKEELSAGYQPRTNADDVGLGEGVPVGDGVTVGEGVTVGDVAGDDVPVEDVVGDGELVGYTLGDAVPDGDVAGDGDLVGDVVGDGVGVGARVNVLVGTGDELGATDGGELEAAEVGVADADAVGDPSNVLASAFPPRMTETTARTVQAPTTIRFSTLMRSVIPANDSP